MAHIERTDHPVMSAYVPPADPAPYTLGTFLDAYYEACKKAWDDPGPDGVRQEPSITLPEGLWPDLAKVVNPVTRTMTPVRRVPMFTWEQPAVDFIAKGHLGTPCPRPRDGGMCGCDEGDDEPQDCLKLHCDH
jgi:hypothetical protein